MRVFRLFAVLSLAGVGAAEAQLAVPQTQNLEKLLILNTPAEPSSDSALAMPVIDAARDRLTAMARYKVMVVPKAKICEALTQSGFPCNALLTPQQAQQLAKALGVNSYNIGRVGHTGGHLMADVRIISGGSGFSTSFTVDGGNPGTPQALGESIAQRLNTIVRAAEFARGCNEQRARNALDRALAEANKAFAIEPNLAAANLCVATIWEIRHQPDSVRAAARRALKGDPGNSEAWNRVASTYMLQGDTVGAFDAFDSLLSYNKTDGTLRKGLASLMIQQKKYERAARLLKEGLEITPGDQQMADMRKRACIEGGLYSCTLEILRAEAQADSTKLADTTTLKLALANAQAASDTQSMLWWARQAVRHFRTSVSFHKQLAAAYAMSGQPDSAVAEYKQALAVTPNDVSTSLLIAQTIVGNAVWDTAAVRKFGADSAGLKRARQAFADKVDAARPYLAPGFTSADSSIRLFTTNVGYTAGSKLAQAGLLDRALPWLEQAFQQLATDTVAQHQPLRSITGYWYGLASTYTMAPLLQQLGTSKKCDMGPALNDRIQRSKQALNLGSRVAPQAVRQPLSVIAQFETFMQSVKKSFKCTNF